MTKTRVILVAMVLAGCAGQSGAGSEPPPRAPDPIAAESTPAPAAPTSESTTAAPADSPPIQVSQVSAPAAEATPIAKTSEAEPPPPVDVAPPDSEGTLVSRSGKTVRMKVAPGTTPSEGSSGTLLRYFEGKSGQKSPLGALSGLLGGNATISGWIAIAQVKVKKLDGEQVTLEIEKESSKMIVNGKPLNHFTPGARLRLAAK